MTCFLKTSEPNYSSFSNRTKANRGEVLKRFDVAENPKKLGKCEQDASCSKQSRRICWCLDNRIHCQKVFKVENISYCLCGCSVRPNKCKNKVSDQPKFYPKVRRAVELLISTTFFRGDVRFKTPLNVRKLISSFLILIDQIERKKTLNTFKVFLDSFDLKIKVQGKWKDFNRFKPVFKGHKDFDGIRLQRAVRLAHFMAMQKDTPDQEVFICDQGDEFGTCNFPNAVKSSHNEHVNFHEKNQKLCAGGCGNFLSAFTFHRPNANISKCPDCKVSDKKILKSASKAECNDCEAIFPQPMCTVPNASLKKHVLNHEKLKTSLLVSETKIKNLNLLTDHLEPNSI